jgi:hypothetical protein
VRYKYDSQNKRVFTDAQYQNHPELTRKKTWLIKDAQGNTLARYEKCASSRIQ